MKYKEFGSKNLPTIIILHGGGLSWWSLKNIINDLKNIYHIVTPIIDGHGEDGESTFVSIEESAQKLINYIDNNYNGRVYAMCGLSLGAQIIIEILSQRAYIANYAVIESALVYPIKGINILIVPMYKLFYGLIKKKWFAKLQSKALFVPDDMFELYYHDSLKISKQSLINIILSNTNYQIKDTIRKTKTKVLIIVGSKELRIMRKSADKLYSMISNSKLYIADKMGHGEMSLVQYKEYIDLIKCFFAE